MLIWIYFGYDWYKLHSIFRCNFQNIEIPDGYEGFYISYEEYEATERVTGVLTRNDFRSQDWITKDGIQVNRYTANDAKSDNMLFYRYLLIAFEVFSSQVLPNSTQAFWRYT